MGVKCSLIVLGGGQLGLVSFLAIMLHKNTKISALKVDWYVLVLKKKWAMGKKLWQPVRV